MIRTTKVINPNNGQTKNLIRIDSTIKVIGTDDSITTSPITIQVDVTRLTPKQQMMMYKLSSLIYDKEQVIGNNKPTEPKKAWWRIW
jgi:hypothetical protein